MTMEEGKYMTAQQTSKFLQVSISTLTRFIKRNTIPSYKIANRRLFDKDELVEWVRTKRSELQVNGSDMKYVMPEAEGQSFESIIDSLQCQLCMLTGEHELSNGDTCRECEWYRSCQELLDAL